MVGVGIDDQLSVREVLLQDELVDRIDDQVFVAVPNQRRLLDGLEIVVGALALDAPFRDRLSLPRAGPLVHLGIAVHPTEMLALQELPPCSLSLLGRTEMTREP